jgi:pimeloyl-ACP methyl ester carboxylesterase
MGPAERCARAWEILRPLYVAKPEDSDKLSAWGGCDLPNEQNAMQHYNAYIAPSMKALTFTPEQLANIGMPVLTIHGKMDRSAPYGGGREWTLRLPHARLLTIANAAHAPWVEAPDAVFEAIERFLQGDWPESARTPAALRQERGQARSGESARCSRAASTRETACAETPDSR